MSEINLSEQSGEVVTPNDPPVKEPVPAAPPSADPSAQPDSTEAASDFKVGEWAGLPNYGCPFCVFSTLDGDAAIRTHIIHQHPQEA